MLQGGDSTSDPNRRNKRLWTEHLGYDPKSRTVEAFERLVTEVIE